MIGRKNIKPIHIAAVAGAAALAALAAGAFAPASAQQKGKSEAKTPAAWSYDVKDGRRVPRADRVTNADGSWREEVRRGACVTVRTMSADGVYREVRECD